MLRRLLLSVLATVLPLAPMLVPSTANAATAASCNSGVAVSQFSFNPTSIPTTVTLNQYSTLTLVLQNCATQTIQGSTIWFGQYAGQSCPVIDPPPATPFTIAAGATYTLTNTYGSAAGPCQPTSLTIHANVNVNGVGTVTTTTATLQFSPSCAGNGIAVNQFSFSPTTVTLNQYSTLTLVLQNCTGQSVQGESSWFPKYTWSGSGLPPGCPVQDPIQFSYSMAPGATATAHLGLGDNVASCLATGIQVTANVYENGVTAAVGTATADLAITQPNPNSCQVSYAPDNWQGGFTANVTIADKGSSTINGWTLTFAFPGNQTITSAWNATVTQTGAGVTAANMSYNAAIPPGGSQSFGFQGTWTANDASPANFSVNGTPCA
jgi:hypothetical protein